MKKKVYGIAGYIGSGKSMAGAYFKALGADFIDADEVVDGLYQKGEAGYEKIVQYFGDRFLRKDGSLDRKKIARFIFNDANKLKIINNLIHPLVTLEIKKRINASKAEVVFIEAICFLPTQIGALVDKILWIDCGKKILKERVEKSGGLMFEIIYKSQKKPGEINEVVENVVDKATFRRALKKVWDKWCV
ncbi:dephospho-CoA kinase [Patescibacteria group bacterium]|nr:dephospho-CoA kinase [Patescibacteria group bacterium]MBU1703382.1 dephospho-CoA kinase [Patescibacteria group bacterium]MBU1953823.1 dephospho-CoA kinase [Patescibacteria group bacterium]